MGPEKIRAVLRKALGPLIWLRHTLPDIGYDVVRLSAEFALAVTAVAVALRRIAIEGKLRAPPMPTIGKLRIRIPWHWRVLTSPIIASAETPPDYLRFRWFRRFG